MNEELKVNVQPIEDSEINEVSGGAGQARWISYVVVRGDTLGKIAHRFGVSVSDICNWNEISDPDWIIAGQRLSIYTRR